MKATESLGPLIDRFQRRALIAAVVGGLLAILGAFLYRGEANRFDRAYLYSYVFFLGLSLGSLALLMLHRQLGGAWGFLIRRPLESGAMTLPLMAVLFAPILIDLENIYPWVRYPIEAEVPEGGNPNSPAAVKSSDEPVAKGSPLLVHNATIPGSSGVRRDPLAAATADLFEFKKMWLNPTWFTIRMAIYFVIWITLAVTLNVGSRRQDETESTSLAYFLQSLSAPGLVLYFLTASLALIDWGMSLEPKWYSSLYGVLIMIGQGVSTMALMILVTAVLTRRGIAEPSLATRETFNDLGNLLLTFVMLWGYLSFSQFLIIWAGNLSEEIPWYSRRFHGGWINVGRFLMLFHFAVPFLILLARPLKRNIDALWKIAALVIVAHLVDAYWLIAPSFIEGEGFKTGEGHPAFFPSWLDLAIPVGMGGLWLWTFLWFLKSKPLMVVSDPELLPALKQAGGH